MLVSSLVDVFKILSVLSEFYGLKWQNLKKLENVAINNVLPLKAAQRDVIANLKWWGLGTPAT